MTTTKLFATGVALAALALPSGAVADTTPATTPSASEQCKAMRTTLGAKAFGEAYGTNANRANAFGKCVSRLSSAQSAGRAEAAKACTAEQTADPAAFKAKYGVGKKDANAFKKCVNAKAAKAAAKAKSDQLSAAKACKAERAGDRAAFDKKYGTNANKRNAFGKCVSATAKAKNDPAPAPAA